MAQQMHPLEPVRLYGGDVVPRASVAVVHLSLQGLIEKDQITFYELVMICRDPSHQIWSSRNKEVLRRLGLLEADGQPHDLIRSIVRSSVTGEMLQMRLVWPIDPNGAPITPEEGWELPDSAQFLEGVIPDDGSLLEE